MTNRGVERPNDCKLNAEIAAIRSSDSNHGDGKRFAKRSVRRRQRRDNRKALKDQAA